MNDASSGADEPSAAAFELLAHPVRLSVVRHLLETDEPAVDTETLVEAVVDDPKLDAERRSAAIALRHVHLTRMADLGVVAYDADDDRVQIDRTELTRALERARSTVATLLDERSDDR